MRTLILALTVALFATSFAQAQQTAAPLTSTVPVEAECGSKDRITMNLLKKYGEKPFVQGAGITKFFGSKSTAPGIMRIWVNNSSWTFTITMEDPKGDAMCIILTGTKLSPTKVSPGDQPL